MPSIGDNSPVTLTEAVRGAQLLASRLKTTVIVHWKQAASYGFATEHRLLSGKRRLSKWRYRIHPDGKSEKL